MKGSGSNRELLRQSGRTLGGHRLGALIPAAVRVAVICVLIQALLPFLAFAADRGLNGSPSDQAAVVMLCTADGLMAVAADSEGQPSAPGGDGSAAARVCPVCWGLGPAGLIPAAPDVISPAPRPVLVVGGWPGDLTPRAGHLARPHSRGPPVEG